LPVEVIRILSKGTEPLASGEVYSAKNPLALLPSLAPTILEPTKEAPVFVLEALKSIDTPESTVASSGSNFNAVTIFAPPAAFSMCNGASGTVIPIPNLLFTLSQYRSLSPVTEFIPFQKLT
jgi:hypothetical protein